MFEKTVLENSGTQQSKEDEINSLAAFLLMKYIEVIKFSIFQFNIIMKNG